MFRILYSTNAKNPQDFFSVSEYIQQGLSSAAQLVAEANASCIASGKALDDMNGLDKNHIASLSPEVISKNYPLFASSLYNLIQTSETRIKSNNSKKR